MSVNGGPRCPNCGILDGHLKACLAGLRCDPAPPVVHVQAVTATVPAEVFLVTAYAWGDRRDHAYIVGLYLAEEDAMRAKTDTDYDRKGRYVCEVRGLPIIVGRTESRGRVIAELPEPRRPSRAGAEG